MLFKSTSAHAQEVAHERGAAGACAAVGGDQAPNSPWMAAISDAFRPPPTCCGLQQRSVQRSHGGRPLLNLAAGPLCFALEGPRTCLISFKGPQQLAFADDSKVLHLNSKCTLT